MSDLVSWLLQFAGINGCTLLHWKAGKRTALAQFAALFSRPIALGMWFTDAGLTKRSNFVEILMQGSPTSSFKMQAEGVGCQQRSNSGSKPSTFRRFLEWRSCQERHLIDNSPGFDQGRWLDMQWWSYDMSCEIAIGHPSYHPLYLACLSSCEDFILALLPLHLAQALR